MGGDMWTYWADYEPDINLVLQKARQEAFREGNYYLAPKPLSTWLGKPIDPDSPWDPEIPPDYLEWLHWLKSAGDRPTSIEELISWNGPSGNGTRSIIDISEVGDQLYWGGTTCPVSDDLLLEWFGTTKPHAKMVEQMILNMLDLTGRGTAVHVIVYDEEEPSQVVFVGRSVD